MKSNVRLPPGQVEVKNALLRHIGNIPEIDGETWRLEVIGEVEKPREFSFSDLNSMPSIVIISDFHCVEGWSVLNNRWEGVQFKLIFEAVKPREAVKYVIFECYDGYATSLPLFGLLKEDVLLAYRLNGKPLSPERGGPVRLIVPQKYAYKSPMWLKKIEFAATNKLGYWERRGYSDTADPWEEDRYAK